MRSGRDAQRGAVMTFGVYMKINKETTTPKQQEQQQEQLQEHQQQSPATNGIKQPPFSDTSRASAALSSASLSFIAQKGRQNMCKLLDNVQKGETDPPIHFTGDRHHGPHPPFAHPP